MFNCIKADALRVLKKASFNVMTLIVVLLMIGAAALTLLVKVDPGKAGLKEAIAAAEQSDDGEMTTEQAMEVLADAFTFESRAEAYSGFVSPVLGMLGLLIGVPIFLAVFSDDFKSKAMQTAIGYGISRSKLILCRIMEVIWLICQTAIIFSVVGTVCALVLGGNAKIVGEILGDVWLSMAKIIFYVSIPMMIVYAMQNATLALVTFILMTLGTVDMVLSGIGAIPILSKHNIDPSIITIGSVLDKATDMKYNLWPLMWVILIVCYIILPVFLTMKIFEKKELEF